MIALPISMPRFKSIIFYQNRPKIKLFLQKMQSFRALGASPPDPRASGVWAGGFAPHPQPPTAAYNSLGLLNLPNHAPHCEFLATRLVANKILKQTTCIYKQVIKNKFSKCRCFAPGLPNHSQAKT